MKVLKPKFLGRAKLLHNLKQPDENQNCNSIQKDHLSPEDNNLKNKELIINSSSLEIFTTPTIQPDKNQIIKELTVNSPFSISEYQNKNKRKKFKITLPVRSTASVEFIFCTSSLLFSQKEIIRRHKKLLKNKNIRFTGLIQKATHLVVKNYLCSRTYKYMFAGIKGIPIIAFDFLEQLIHFYVNKKTKKIENLSDSQETNNSLNAAHKITRKILENQQWWWFTIEGDIINGPNTFIDNWRKKSQKIFKNVVFQLKKECICKKEYKNQEIICNHRCRGSINSETQKILKLTGGKLQVGTKVTTNIEIDHITEIFDFICGNIQFNSVD